MTENININNPLTSEEKEKLMTSLLKKEGCWVDWGKACQKLQQGGVQPSEIFEACGLQNSQQNLVIVASQVFDSLVKNNADDNLLQYYQGPRSDVLYELRVLNHEQRLSAAILAQQKNLDVDGAKEVAKAVQHFSRLSQPPSGFTFHPGDALAYQYWKSARQKKILADKARLIAQGLKFAHSDTARQKVEQLLTDMAEVPTQSAPLLPMYRLENDEQLPCILPVVGSFPLTAQALDDIPVLESSETFGVTKVKRDVAIVTIPSWQAVLKAEKPVAILCNSNDLPKETNANKSEELLVVVDLAIQAWDSNSYFLQSENNQLKFSWFATEPNVSILGQLLIVLRPRKIFDEGNLTQPWQMDD